MSSHPADRCSLNLPIILQILHVRQGHKLTFALHQIPHCATMSVRSFHSPSSLRKCSGTNARIGKDRFPLFATGNNPGDQFRHRRSLVRLTSPIGQNTALACFSMLTLVSASKAGNRDSLAVFDGEYCVGHVMRTQKSPPGKPWFWTIFVSDRQGSAVDRGYAATRQQAMADFEAIWLRLLRSLEKERAPRIIRPRLLHRRQTKSAAKVRHRFLRRICLLLPQSGHQEGAKEDKASVEFNKARKLAPNDAELGAKIDGALKSRPEKVQG